MVKLFHQVQKINSNLMQKLHLILLHLIDFVRSPWKITLVHINTWSKKALSN